jgi:23S rRNA (adenine2503-C2)-methyltransferase
MEALARRPEQFGLAISLHSPDPAARLGLMPIEKKYHLRDVLEAAKPFRHRLTFEYVLIAGRNDRESDAVALATLARGLGAHVNLLPLHPGGGAGLTPTPPKAIRAFREALVARGVEAVVRRSRGLDIDAACGQLRVRVERRRAVARGS